MKKSGLTGTIESLEEKKSEVRKRKVEIGGRKEGGE